MSPPTRSPAPRPRGSWAPHATSAKCLPGASTVTSPRILPPWPARARDDCLPVHPHAARVRGASHGSRPRSPWSGHRAGTQRAQHPRPAYRRQGRPLIGRVQPHVVLSGWTNHLGARRVILAGWRRRDGVAGADQELGSRVVLSHRSRGYLGADAAVFGGACQFAEGLLDGRRRASF